VIPLAFEEMIDMHELDNKRYQRLTRVPSGVNLPPSEVIMSRGVSHESTSVL